MLGRSNAISKGTNVVAKSGTYRVSSSASKVTIKHGIGKTPTHFGVKRLPLYGQYNDTTGIVTANASSLIITTAITNDFVNTGTIEWFAVLVE